MSAAMTFKQLGEVLKYCAEHNSPTASNYEQPTVKYVHPNIDMRTNRVFSITFRGYGGPGIIFHTQNECRDLDRSLFQRCMDYLEMNDTTTSVPGEE